MMFIGPYTVYKDSSQKKKRHKKTTSKHLFKMYIFMTSRVTGRNLKPENLFYKNF